ncbi:hypothetical protein NDGK_00656 [Clostridiales bacterium CHKCI001]|nr:hypothetical protein NDGK_00656 [Clostridiales bacterium CHKCI001]
MAATINNLNLSSIVYAQQESSSIEDNSTEIQNSTEDKSEAAEESSAQESRESSTPEETSEQINQEGSNVQVDSSQSQKTSEISYETQLEGETKLKRKQLKFPLNGWENVELEIEEVYVKSGNTLKAGDPILKISSESMQKLLEYYNNQIDAAQAEVEQKEVSYELEKRNAEYEREQAKQSGEMAASIRDTQLQSLQTDATDLAKQIEQITLQMDNYEKALANNTYYEEYGIIDMAEAVENSRRLMENVQRMLSEAQSGSQNVDSATLELLQNMVNQAENSYSLMQEQYDKLLSDYGRKVSEAQTEKNKLQDTLSSLQEEYNDKQEKDESQSIEINKEYDRAILLSNQAEERYNIVIETLDEELNETKANIEKWEKARDELYAMEDGIIYAEQDMIVSSFRYHNGDKIEEQKSLLSYDDAASVLINVNVPQDEIVDWNVGDIVKIAVEGYEQLFSGTVSAMDLERAVQKNTDEIEYNVTIAIEQGEQQLKDGLDATVLCGEIIENTTSEDQETERSSEETSQNNTESSGEDVSQSQVETSQNSTESSTELSTELLPSGGTQ